MLNAEWRKLRKALLLSAFCILHSAFVVLPTHAGQLAVFVGGGKSITTWHGQADLQAISVEYTRARSRRTDLGIALEPQILWQPRSWFGYDFGNGNEKVRAIAALVVARRRFWTNSARLQPYIEGSIGPIWAEKQVPASTSRFNFTTQPGFGFVLRPHSRTPLMIGYRFMHISNGGYSPRNPGLNVSALVVGVRLR